MEYSEALEIMGLNSNFTDKQLKRNYKELMRKWHPDICKEPDATEMCKKINTARDVLSGKDKSSKPYHSYDSSTYKSSDIDLNAKKKYYTFEVEKLYIGALMIGIDGEQSNFAMIALLNLRNKVLHQIYYGKSCSELDNIFNWFKSDYLKGLNKYINHYCIENCMSLEAVDAYIYRVDKKRNININRNVFKVYQDLEEVKAKRNVLKKIKSKFMPYM